MTDENRDLEGLQEDSLGKTEELIWKYLDDILPEGELPALEELIQSEDGGVQLYLDCVRLHADLITHFKEEQEQKKPSPPGFPVLGSLEDSLPGIDAGPPVADN